MGRPGEPRQPLIPQAWRAESYAERARRAADRGNWEAARYLMHRSLRANPLGAGYRLQDEGIALYMAGKLAEAYRTFEEAAPLCDDGEPDAWAARCALSLSREDLAELCLLRALGRDHLSPATLSEIATEATFALLREKDDVQRAIQEAADRLYPDGPGDPAAI